MEDFVVVTAVGSLIIFVAFFIRSLTGFGSALVSIPLLALLFDLKFAVPLEALFEVGISILLMRKVYKAISKTTLVPLIIGTIIGSLLGAYILYSFANVFLKRMLGVAIILFALSSIRCLRRFFAQLVGWGSSYPLRNLLPDQGLYTG